MKKVLLTAALGALVFATGCGNNNGNGDDMRMNNRSEKADEMQRQQPASPGKNGQNGYMKHGQNAQQEANKTWKQHTPGNGY